MKHQLMDETDCTCKDTWHENDCWVCRNVVDGGLAVCRVCGGAEGSLTTDCCGRKLTPQEQDDIYNKGILDFVSTRWVSSPNPTNKTWDSCKSKKEEVMTEPSKQNSTSIIVRDKKDPSKQIQVIIDFEKREIGVVHNAGMELLVIETAVLDDVALVHKVLPKE